MLQKNYVKVAPCKGCTDRAVGCHADCKLYIEWSDENTKKRDEIRRQKEIWSDHYYLPTRRSR